ncbi:hypothetical protein ACQZV8_09670 [Magnetococcales bacterium HHB-1]
MAKKQFRPYHNVLLPIFCLQKTVSTESSKKTIGYQQRFLVWNYTDSDNSLSFFNTFRESWFSYALTAPVIWSMIFPLFVLDIMATFYQYVCFPVYNIPRVKRSEFLILDRHKLSYLNWLEKLNCIYCGYGNGVLAYVREIASRTEERWCPIKHARRPRKVHQRYSRFEEYGDADGYCRKRAEKA